MTQSNKIIAKTLIPLLRQAVWNKEIREIIQKSGVDVIPVNYYSSIPSFVDIENSFEYQTDQTNPPYNNDSIFSKKIISQEVEDMIQYASEFNPALTKTNDDAKFYWKNDQFSYCDAMAYYCLIRKLKPKNIIEIGSGFSTLVAIEAVKKNEIGKIHCFEPFPRKFLTDNSSINLYSKIAQHISSGELNSIITEGDILFIDSTHTVKTGSDCNHIYLRLLPSIKQNFHIHVHDMFLPFGLPRNWLTDSQIYWTEQYLLYAFLLDNPKTNVFYSSYYGYNFIREKLEKIMKNKYPVGGGSLWFKYNNK